MFSKTNKIKSSPVTLSLVALSLALGSAACVTTMDDPSDNESYGQVAQANTGSGLPTPNLSCETALAFGDSDATCFIGADFDGDGADDGFNRWGWSNGPLSPGSYTWDVYAGAGQCNLSNGTLVGSLDVVYDGELATVTFNRIGDFVLAEEHIYVGNEPLPRAQSHGAKFGPQNNGNAYTVAPGQFPIVNDLDGHTTTTNYVGRLSGDIYVVYHAVACE